MFFFKFLITGVTCKYLRPSSYPQPWLTLSLHKTVSLMYPEYCSPLQPGIKWNFNIDQPLLNLDQTNALFFEHSNMRVDPSIYFGGLPLSFWDSGPVWGKSRWICDPLLDQNYYKNRNPVVMAGSVIKRQGECSFAPKFDLEYHNQEFYFLFPESEKKKSFSADEQQNYLYGPYMGVPSQSGIKPSVHLSLSNPTLPSPLPSWHTHLTPLPIPPPGNAPMLLAKENVQMIVTHHC